MEKSGERTDEELEDRDIRDTSTLEKDLES